MNQNVRVADVYRDKQVTIVQMQINDRMRCARKKKNFSYQKANIVIFLSF